MRAPPPAEVPMVPVPGGGAAPATSATGLVETLVRMHGEAARPRAERGVKQVAAFWRAEDGDAAALQRFVTSEFIADPAVLARTRDRLAEAFEAADGHLLEISRTWRAGAELERGPELPIDGLLAATDPGAHLQEDLFASRIAFTVLLNWPLDTLDEMVAQGPGWSRTRWAEARLAGRFATRPSGAALAERAEASSAAEAYIAGYNLWVHHLVASDGQRPFPSGKRLLSHWNLRDQIKADYAEGAGGPRPAASHPLGHRAHRRPRRFPGRSSTIRALDWDPVKNTVVASPGRRGRAPAGRADRQGRGAGGGLRRARAGHALRPPPRATSRPRGAWTGTRPSRPPRWTVASSSTTRFPRRASGPCWSRSSRLAAGRRRWRR